MLKIKLKRVGKKHDPSFRVVITDQRSGPKSNKYTEIVGHYDFIKKTVDLKADKIKYWISKGAQPTETVHNILVKEKIIEGKLINVLPKKSPIIDEKKIAEEKEKAEEKLKKAEEEKTKLEEKIEENKIEEDSTKADEEVSKDEEKLRESEVALEKSKEVKITEKSEDIILEKVEEITVEEKKEG